MLDFGKGRLVSAISHHGARAKWRLVAAEFLARQLAVESVLCSNKLSVGATIYATVRSHTHDTSAVLPETSDLTHKHVQTFCLRCQPYINSLRPVAESENVFSFLFCPSDIFPLRNKHTQWCAGA